MITLTKKSQTFWGLVSGWMCFNSRIWHLSVPTPGTVNLRDPWKNYSAKFDALVQFDEDHLNFFFFYQSISWKTNKQTNKKKIVDCCSPKSHHQQLKICYPDLKLTIKTFIVLLCLELTSWLKLVNPVDPALLLMRQRLWSTSITKYTFPSATCTLLQLSPKR